MKNTDVLRETKSHSAESRYSKTPIPLLLETQAKKLKKSRLALHSYFSTGLT